MRTLLLLLSSCLIAGNSAAQRTAGEILDRSAAKIKAYAAAEVEFLLTMENIEENIREEHHGHACMMGNKYKLDIMDVVNYFDGETIYTYTPEFQEVTIKLPEEEEEEMLNPVTIFNIHKADFKQKLVSDNDSGAYIELYPNKTDKNYTKIGVRINKNHDLLSVKSFGKDGNNLIIAIKAIRQPAVIPDNTFFTFDTGKHPEVEVIDMR